MAAARHVPFLATLGVVDESIEGKECTCRWEVLFNGVLIGFLAEVLIEHWWTFLLCRSTAALVNTHQAEQESPASQLLLDIFCASSQHSVYDKYFYSSGTAK